MSDLISKADVLEMLEKRLVELDGLYQDGHPDAVLKWYGVNWARVKIADMPSAEPERKPGRWIYLGDGYKCPWSCSNCSSCSDERTDYCPMCGAKMEGGKGWVI